MSRGVCEIPNTGLPVVRTYWEIPTWTMVQGRSTGVVIITKCVASRIRTKDFLVDLILRQRVDMHLSRYLCMTSLHAGVLLASLEERQLALLRVDWRGNYRKWTRRKLGMTSLLPFAAGFEPTRPE